MTRLERLRLEIVALAESLPNVLCPVCAPRGMSADPSYTALCGECRGAGSKPHPLAAPLRGIAWSLLPREERYREPEHGGGPLTSGDVNVNKAASELAGLTERLHIYGNHTEANHLFDIAAELLTAVVQARPGETLDDVLKREGMELAEETCATCGGSCQATTDDGYFCVCPECRDGRVVIEDAIDVRVAGQVRYARRRDDADDNGERA